MKQSGLTKIFADRRDYSLVHTFGAIADPAGLPEDFSIYDGREIPDQNAPDTRFSPPLPPLPMGCTGETAAFESGLQDGKLYDPKWIYDHTPPGGPGGRGMRDMLQFLIDNGPAQGTDDPNRTAYFNCYGAGAIDDFDAARIALWINQNETRGVYVGTWWYPDFLNHMQWEKDGSLTATPLTDGILSIPSNWDTRVALLHAWLVVGWMTKDGKEYLIGIPWGGMKWADKGLVYVSRELYNALMSQPYTGAFTITKLQGQSPVPIGFQAVIDHLVYFVRNLFRIPPTMPSQTPQDASDEAQVNETPVEPPTPKQSKIEAWARVIQKQEGGRPTDLNMRNNNPGNLKYSSYTHSLGGRPSTVASDGGVFCKFITYDAGFKALCQFLTDACNNKLKSYKNVTLEQFTNIYAHPPTRRYAEEVARELDVPLDTPIKFLL